MDGDVDGRAGAYGGPSRADGLTAVELSIAVAVVALLVGAALVFAFQRREQQRVQLQAALDATPGQILDVTLRLERDAYRPGESMDFILEIRNPTIHRLELKWRHWGVELLGIYAPSEPNAADPSRTLEARSVVTAVSVREGSRTWTAFRPETVERIDKLAPGARIAYRLETPNALQDVLGVCGKPGMVYANLLYEPDALLLAPPDPAAAFVRFGTKVFECEYVRLPERSPKGDRS